MKYELRPETSEYWELYDLCVGVTSVTLANDPTLAQSMLEGVWSYEYHQETDT